MATTPNCALIPAEDNSFAACTMIQIPAAANANPAPNPAAFFAAADIAVFP